ncbi:MAG: nitroreductase family protein [Sulfuricurvum sp.]
MYRKGQLSISGNYHRETIHLLLEQRFISGANMILLIYADQFSAYSHIEAGIYAQDMYLACEHLGVGCSAIGAFYDEEASQWSDQPLLYAVAIGGKS